MIKAVFRSYRRAPGVLGLALLVAAMASPAAAAQALSLAEAARLATQEEPGQSKLAYRAEALQQQAVAAEQLPDPVLRVGLSNVPTDTFDVEQEAMTQLVVGVRQMFPKGDSLSHQAATLRARADGASQAAQSRALDAGLLAQKAWLETYYWEQAQQIVEQNRELFEQLVNITNSLYAVGRKAESDVVRAQLEVSRLDLRLTDIREKILQNRAELARWIGPQALERPLSAELGQYALADLADLEKRLERHPLLAEIGARIRASQAQESLAREQFKPGFGVDLSYGARGAGRSDLVSAVLTVDMPLWGGTKQDAGLTAAIRNTEAERALRVETYRKLQQELQVEYSRFRQFDRQLGLYQQRIIPEVAQQTRSSLVAYQSDRGDFSDLMRASIGELNTQLEFRRLRVDQALARAKISNLVGDQS